MPILFAVSPFAAMRSAPVRTQSTSPAAIIRPAAESAITVNGIPSASSSHAVRREPWSSGRVSPTSTCASRPLLPRGPQRAERRPVTAGREGARVAVRERARPRLEQHRGVRGHPLTALDLVTVDSSRVLDGRFGAHLIECPTQVDRRRAALAKRPFGRDEILALRRSERVAVRRRDPDRRRPANRERPDRLRHLGGGAALQLHLFVRQPPLVEQDNPAVLEPHDAVRRQTGARHP